MDKEFVAWLKAAKALVEIGWARGNYWRDELGVRCYCAAGAMLKTEPPKAPRWNHDEVVAWNDAPGRTQAEVLAMFDNSIRALEEA